MPRSASFGCLFRGCPSSGAQHGYCEDHARERPSDRSRGRKTAYERGYTRKWQKAARLFRIAHPLCVACKRRGVDTLSQVVDHIIPHRGDRKLMWDIQNWQALCKKCHDMKTARGE